MEEQSIEDDSTEKQRLHEDIARIKAALQSDGDVESGDESDVGSDNDGQFASADGGPMAGVYFGWPEAPHLMATFEDPHQTGAVMLEPQFENDDGELPANAETCLALNRAYQEIISENLQKVEMVLAHNKDRQVELNSEIEKSAESRQKDTTTFLITQFAVPYFKDSNGMYPPPNEDVRIKRISKDREPYPKLSKLMSEEDKRKLREAVRKDALKRLIQPLMNRREIEYEKLRDSVSEDEQAEIRIRIEKINEDIIMAELTPEKQLWGRVEESDKIDWLKISASDFDGQVSAENLIRYWKTLFHPNVSKGKWTADEDQKLAELVYDHAETDWEQIALELGTQRSGFMCLQRWKTKLDPKLQMTLKWTKEEDQILHDLVDTLKSGICIPWEEVSERMEGRTVEQCLRRYDELCNGGRPGKLTTEEDVKILVAVHCYGLKDWNKISSLIPGRSGDQCRERYTNSLAPTLKLGDWTYDEDKFLIQAVQQYGKVWTKITPHMAGRTDNMALQRYKRLLGWKELADASGNLPVKCQNMLDGKGKKKTSKKSKGMRKTLGEIKKAVEKKKKLGLVEESFELTPTRMRAQQTYIKKLKKESEVLKMYRDTKAEIEEIERDIEQGVYVPRPPSFNNTQLPGTNISKNNLIEHRQQLFRIVKERMKGVLCEGLEPQENLGKDIKNIIRKNKLNSMDLKSRLNEMIQILAREKNILKVNEQLQQKKERDPVIKRHHERLDAAITQQLGGRQPRQITKVGRPRKFMDDDDVSLENVKSLERQLLLGDLNETASDIGAVMMKAMNVKYDETAKRAVKHKLHIEQQNNEIPGCLKAYELIVNSDKHKALNPMAVLFDTLVEKNRYVTQEVQERYRHQPFMGSEGTKAYTMPPWPPNSTNLEAFKNLLLNRKMLMMHAGDIYQGVQQPGGRLQNTDIVDKGNADDSGEDVDDSQEESVPTDVVETASDAPQQVNVVPQQNVEGPLVITNHMNMPINVVIKTEQNSADSFVYSETIVNNTDEALGDNEVGLETTVESNFVEDEAHNSWTFNEPEPGTSQQQMIEKGEPQDVSQEDQFEGFVSQCGKDLSGDFLDEQTIKALSGKIKSFDLDVDCLDPFMVKRLSSRFSTGDVFRLRELLEQSTSASKKIKSESSAWSTSSSRHEDTVIAKIRNTHSYQLLKSRFNSLFLWPAILSTLPLENNVKAGEVTERPPGRKPKATKGKGYAMTCGKHSRRFQVKRREEKAELKEKRRQSCQQTWENKKLLAEGLITEEEFKKISEEKKLEAQRKREATYVKSPQQVDEGTGDPPKKKRGRPRGSRTTIVNITPTRVSSRIAIKSTVTESENNSDEEPECKRMKPSKEEDEQKDESARGDTQKTASDSVSAQTMDIGAAGDS